MHSFRPEPRFVVLHNLVSSGSCIRHALIFHPLQLPPHSMGLLLSFTDRLVKCRSNSSSEERTLIEKLD